MVAVAVLRSGRQRLELVIQILDVTVLVMVAHQIRMLVINMVGNVSYWLKINKGYHNYTIVAIMFPVLRFDFDCRRIKNRLYA